MLDYYIKRYRPFDALIFRRQAMQIAVGSDHAGFDLKQVVMTLLSESGYNYEDFGSYVAYG